MSTRCQTIILRKNKKHYIYRHHDGYPEGAGQDLKEFINEYKNDFNVLSLDEIAERLNDFHSGFENENLCVHGDEDYIYVMDLDNNELKCYKIPWDKVEDAGEEFNKYVLKYIEKF